MNMMQYAAVIIWRNRNVKNESMLLFRRFASIDEEIAHVSVAKAKEMLLKKISNADAKKSLQSTRFTIFPWKRSTCWRFMIIRQIILIRSMTARSVRIPAISEIKSVIVSSRRFARFFTDSLILKILAGNRMFFRFPHRLLFFAAKRQRERLSPRENIENVLSVSRSFIECFDSRSRTESFYLWECRCWKDISFKLYCRRAAESWKRSYLSDCLSVF